MSVINGWTTKRLDQLGGIYSGSTPSTAIRNFWDGDIVWITPYDLSRLNTPYIHDSAKRITKKGLSACSATLLPPKSIVMSSRAPIGYLALPTSSFCTNQGCKTLRLSYEFNPEFTYYNLLFNMNKIKSLGEGTTFAEISKAALSTIAIDFPERLNEQSKIAEVLSTVDRAIEQTENLIAKQQRIKTGLMQDLFTRGIDEHGNLRSEETHAFKDSQLGRVPVVWDHVTLGTRLVTIEQGWSPDCDNTSAAEGEWGVLKTTSVVWSGYQDRENKTLPRNLKPIPRYEVKPGDVLMTRGGPNSRVGVVAYVFRTQSKLMLSDKLYRLVPDDSIEPEFLVLALSSFETQRHLSTLKTGLAESQTNISQKIVRQLKIALPKKPEQEQIANALRNYSQSIISNINYHRKLLSIKTALMQDLLTGKVRVTALLEKTELNA